MRHWSADLNTKLQEIWVDYIEAEILSVEKPEMLGDGVRKGPAPKPPMRIERIDNGHYWAIISSQMHMNARLKLIATKLSASFSTMNIV